MSNSTIQQNKRGNGFSGASSLFVTSCFPFEVSRDHGHHHLSSRAARLVSLCMVEVRPVSFALFPRLFTFVLPLSSRSFAVLLVILFCFFSVGHLVSF